MRCNKLVQRIRSRSLKVICHEKPGKHGIYQRYLFAHTHENGQNKDEIVIYPFFPFTKYPIIYYNKKHCNYVR